MPSYNRVVLVGNLTRDPQLKYLPSQTAVCEFALAINHKYKTASGEQREEVCFIECSCFGKPGEIINQYMQKGKPLLVEGRLKFDTWEDKQGGGKRSKHSVFVENFQFLGGRDDAPAGGGGGNGGGREQSNTGGYGRSGGGYKMDDDGPPARQSSQPASRGPKRPDPKPEQPPEEAPYGDEQHFDEDDIPF